MIIEKTNIHTAEFFSPGCFVFFFLLAVKTRQKMPSVFFVCPLEGSHPASTFHGYFRFIPIGSQIDRAGPRHIQYFLREWPTESDFFFFFGGGVRSEVDGFRGD